MSGFLKQSGLEDPESDVGYSGQQGRDGVPTIIQTLPFIKYSHFLFPFPAGDCGGGREGTGCSRPKDGMVHSSP